MKPARQLSNRYYPSLRSRFSQDDWTLSTLTGCYYFALLLFAGFLFLLGGCSTDKGFNTDVGLKTVISHAPSPVTQPRQDTSRETPEK